MRVSPTSTTYRWKSFTATIPMQRRRRAVEYHQMINQFPTSLLIPRAQQHPSDVQEVLAQREYEIGTFYAAHENWAASIARLQTVSDTYPLFRLLLI